MKPQRTRIDICYELLVLAKRPITKTRLIGWGCINNERMSHLLPHLLEQNLLEKTENLYTTTRKGYEFLKAKEDLTKLIS